MPKNMPTKNLCRILTSRVIEAVESDEYRGFCLNCAEDAYGVEPDAENYLCEACGARQVFGAEQVLLMGMTKEDE